MGTLIQDVRLALRTLRKSPVFACVAILSLALGIGANTAIFTLMDQVLLRMLPVQHPEQLVMLDQQGPTQGSVENDNAFSYPMYKDFRDHSPVFSGVLARFPLAMSVSYRGQTERASGDLVSGNYFEVLGVRALIGRTFTQDDDRTPGAHPVAFLMYGYWQRRFGGDRSILNQTLVINGHPMTVVGIGPPGFHGTEVGRSADVMAPIMMKAQMTPTWNDLDNRRSWWLNIFARLKPGVTARQADAAMNVLYRQIQAEEVKAIQGWDQKARDRFVNKHLDILAGDKGQSSLRRDVSAPLTVLMWMVGLVLLIACANVANLLLARTAERGREFAVRASIGASRGRIVRQLLTEGFVFALAGAAAGILVAGACLKLVTTLAMDGIPRIEQAGIDGRILAFSISLAFLTSVLFSFAPALRIGRAQLAGSLKQAAPGNVGGKDRLRSALVVVQVALGLVLLSGAGLLADGFVRLMRRDVGFRPAGLLTFSVALPQPAQKGAKHLDFSSMLIERLAGLPGVESAATATPLPLTGHQITIAFAIEERPTAPSDRPRSDMAFVSPGYFKTVGVPVMEGRVFTEADDAKAPPVLVVNRAFAEKFFPGESAVGKRIQPGATVAGVRSGMREIVGVVGNARQEALGTAPDPIYYYAAKQLPWCCAPYIVRTAGSPLALEASIRQIVASLDPNAPVYEVATVEDRLASGIAGPRFLTFLLLAFAGIALLLTVVGLYGVLTYSVLTRTREIGLRVALGAGRGEVLGMVLKEGFGMVAIGTVLGLAGAAGGNRVALQMARWGGTPQVFLLLTACGVIVASAAIAAYFPARRAASVDPMRVLRNE